MIQRLFIEAFDADRPLVLRFLDLHTARSYVANYAAPLGRNLGGARMGLDNRDPTV